MSDENERSVASAGSAAGNPAAYRVDVEGIGSIMPLCRDWTEVQGILNRFGGRVFGVAPLYEEPPTLAVAEREAIGVAIQCVEAAMAQRHPEEEEARLLLHQTSATLSRLFDRVRS